MSIDQFYPVSDTIVNCPSGMWQVGMVVKLTEHLNSARNGNRDSESRLVNRIGQLRRCIPKMDLMSTSLKEVFVQAVEWLRSIGRKVDLKNEDAAYWITQRGGAARW